MLLALLTSLAYSNSFTAGFALDNKGLILLDPRVHEATSESIGLIIDHTYWWPQGESGLYRPLTTLSYLFDYAVLGHRDQPAGYHAINLALHILNVWLAYALARRFVAGVSIVAFAVAALWAIHPLTTEAVTNIIGRADLLAAAGVLGGLLLYVKSVETRGARQWGWLAALAATTAAGAFSKESGVALVAVIALFEISELDRRFVGRRLTASLRGWAAIIVPLVVYWRQRSVVLAAALPAEFPYADNPIVGAGFWTGRFTALDVMARSLALVVWPARLSCDYSYAQITLFDGSFRNAIGILAVLTLGAAIASCLRWNRAIFFFGAFAFVTWVPASNLLVPTGTIMAERLMYLPSLGIIAIVVISSWTLAERLRLPGAVPIALAVVVALALGVRTWTRNADWKNDVTLWSAAVGVSPQSAKAHRALAEALYDADGTHSQLDRAIEEAERSVAIVSSLPDDLKPSQSYRQVAAYHLDRGERIRQAAAGSESPEAGRAFQRALDAARQCLTVINASRARIPGASTGPAADAHRLLAAAYLGLHQPQRALDEARTALALNPTHALPYRQTAAASLDLGRADEAVIALMTGLVATGDPGFNRDVSGLYRAGLDTDGCAVKGTASEPLLDPSCPIVRRHLCAGYARAILAVPARADAKIASLCRTE